MSRPLFVRELRDALVVDLWSFVVLGSVLAAAGSMLQLGVLVLLERFLLPILVALGFAAGERCFPISFKERYLLFFSSLPLARYKLWLAIVSARLMAAVVSLGSVALVLALVKRRLGFTIPAFPAPQGGYAGAFMLFVVSFLAGGLLSLLARRTVLAYALGLPGIEIALFVLQAFVSLWVIRPSRLESFRTETITRYWLAVLFLSLIGGATTSAYLLAHLEASSKRRVWSYNVVLASLALYASALLAFSFSSAVMSLSNRMGIR